MKKTKEMYINEFKYAAEPVLEQSSLDNVINIYLENVSSNSITKYTYKQYQLEFFSNNWILSRTVSGMTKKVVLQDDELKLLDVNDIQGSLPDLAYYIDFIKNRFGM